MNIITGSGVLSAEQQESSLKLRFPVEGPDIHLPKSVAYAPLINSHDHLVGNWVPRAGDNRPYQNSHIWVEDMKGSFAYRERDQFWKNDGSFDLLEPLANTVARLGAYKNLLSGCGSVEDHAP